MSPKLLRRKTRMSAALDTSKICSMLVFAGLVFLISSVAHAAICPTPPASSTFGNLKFGLSILGYFGAVIAFFIGLRQYKRADY